MPDYIPDYTEDDFRDLVAEVFNMFRERMYCNFLEGDFERILEARKTGQFNPACLHNKMLGVPIRDLPPLLYSFAKSKKRTDRIAHYVIRWRLSLGK